MFEETLDTIIGLTEIEPIEILPRILDRLFARLADPAASAEAPMLEDEIWDTWTSHPDVEAQALMQQAIAAVVGRRLYTAGPLLDDLVRAQPLWPEAWNKRATLFFLRGDDHASARDIRRTLQLEPRHFGALYGFAQICLRHGQTDAALIALEAVVRIHPHLPPARAAIQPLRNLQASRRH